MGVLSLTERGMIVSALATSAQSEQPEPMLGFIGSGSLLTPLEIVSAVERETEDGKAILEILEHGVRREGIDTVVSRLSKILETA
jgi:hypothetical protein